MSSLVKPGTLGKCKNGYQLKEVDLSREKLVSLKEEEMAFGMKEITKKLQRKDEVSVRDIFNLQQEAQCVIINIIKKTFENCSVNFGHYLKISTRKNIVEMTLSLHLSSFVITLLLVLLSVPSSY